MTASTKWGLPRGWETVEFRDIFDRLQYGYTASAIPNSGGTKMLRITDIQQSAVSRERVPGCTIADHVLPQFLLRDGDFVFARTGSIEKACRVRNPPQAVFASYLIRGRPSDPLLSDWISYFVESSDYVNQAVRASAGVGRPNINAKNLGH